MHSEDDQIVPYVAAGPLSAKFLKNGYAVQHGERQHRHGTMLADEVRLELVNKRRLRGRSEVGGYFENYARLADWQLVPGLVDRRPAALVRDARSPSAVPTYFILLEWADDRLVGIRDFRFACYAIAGAEVFVFDG